MLKKITPVLVLLLIALAVQTLLPLISGELTIANAFLALLVVLSVRGGKEAGVIWGALLGGLSDAYFSLPYIGFHGAAFTVLGYILGWIGSKVVIRGVVPLAFFAGTTYVLDAAVVSLLYLLLSLPLASPLILLVLLGSGITAALAAALEAVARRLYPPEVL
jgi:cell shape-determining protein MreD